MFARHTLIILVTLIVGLLTTTAADAALESRLGGQAVYDTDLNITWLADANLAASNTFGESGILAGGLMTWYTAQNWIGAMNATSYLGFNTWRLPTTLYPDASCVTSAYGCTGSEMGHLFYSELGGLAGNSITTDHNASFALFQNIQSGTYWSGTTQYLPYTTSAWTFYMDSGPQSGLQGTNIKVLNNNVWAVLPGDVAAVPEPTSWGLMLSGLILVGAVVSLRCKANVIV